MHASTNCNVSRCSAGSTQHRAGAVTASLSLRLTFLNYTAKRGSIVAAPSAAPSCSNTPASALSVAVVVGNPKPQSRTLSVATSLVEHLFAGDDINVTTVDLATHTEDVFCWPSPELDAVCAQVAGSDIAVFASPTYKASYTGLLKAFLDRYPSNGLAGLVAIPLHTGGDLTHAMGPSVNLAPLLTELGAVVPGRGFYFVTSQMDRMDTVVAEAAAAYRANLHRVAHIAGFTAAPNQEDLT